MLLVPRSSLTIALPGLMQQLCGCLWILFRDILGTTENLTRVKTLKCEHGSSLLIAGLTVPQTLSFQKAEVTLFIVIAALGLDTIRHICTRWGTKLRLKVHKDLYGITFCVTRIAWIWARERTWPAGKQVEWVSLLISRQERTAASDAMKQKLRSCCLTLQSWGHGLCCDSSAPNGWVCTL